MNHWDRNSLAAAISGSIVTPDDPGYDEVRRLWNGAYDQRPAVIVQCASTSDVAIAVRFAQDTRLEIAVRGGGHSIPGYSSCDGGLVIDLRHLNQVWVDPVSCRARVQGGATLADVDAATQAHGLAMPTGSVSDTGIGGLTLGGGMGWLSRLHGLSIDNLTAAEVVVADGRILRADAASNADLFWAIRGGGGNFGVVTEFEFGLHPVGPMVQFAFLFWGADQGSEALRLMRDVTRRLPRSMNVMIVAALTAPPAPFVPAEYRGRTGHALLLPGFGEAADHSRVVSQIRDALPPLFDYVTTMPYVTLQQVMDGAAPRGYYSYDKGAYLHDLTDEVIDLLIAMTPKKASPLSVVEFYRLDGAFSEIAEEETAFGGDRTPKYAAFLIALADDPRTHVADREWVRSLWRALHPHMSGPGYINAIDEPDEQRIHAAYGPKYARLATLKRKYDAQNLFHRNVNIKPTAQEAFGDIGGHR